MVRVACASPRMLAVPPRRLLRGPGTWALEPPADMSSRHPGVNDARRLVGRLGEPLQPGPTGPATLAHQVQQPLRPRVVLDGKCVQKVKR